MLRSRKKSWISERIAALVIPPSNGQMSTASSGDFYERANSDGKGINAAMAGDWRDRVEQRLQETGQSMASVDKRAGFSLGYLSKTLRRSSRPSFENMSALADALEVSVAWLMFGTDIGPDEERLLSAYASLEPDERRAFLDFAMAMLKRQRGQ
jgi:transcriptional regulator with XRE-family HTH domain